MKPELNQTTTAWITGAIWGASLAYLFAYTERPKVDIIIEDPALLE